MVNGFSTVLSWYVNKHFTVSPRFIGSWSRYYGRSRSHTRSFSQILRLRYTKDQTVGYTLRIGQKTLNSNDFTKESSFFVRATAAGTITEHTGHTLQVSLGGVTTENLLAGEDYRTDRWALNYGLGSEMNESLFLRAKIGTKRTRFQTAEEDTSEYYASAGFDYRLAPATLLNGTYRHTWYPRSADREKLHRNTFFLEIEHRF